MKEYTINIPALDRILNLALFIAIIIGIVHLLNMSGTQTMNVQIVDKWYCHKPLFKGYKVLAITPEGQRVFEVDKGNPDLKVHNWYKAAVTEMPTNRIISVEK